MNLIYKKLLLFFCLVFVCLLGSSARTYALPSNGEKSNIIENKIDKTSLTSKYNWQRDLNEDKAYVEKNKIDRCTSSFDENLHYGYIYLGDSRTVGYDYYFDISEKEDTFVVAKSSMGFNWFVNTAEKEIKDIMGANSEIDKWIIISALGINDLGNSSNYIQEYNRLLLNEWETVDLYIMSVNPVEYHDYITNSDIEQFNNLIKEAGFNYIDTYTSLCSMGYGTVDGIHYDMSTYNKIKKILDIAFENIGY